MRLFHYAACCPTGPDVEPITFVGRTDGRIVTARGPSDFGWDPVFEPAGFAETYAELDKDIKNTISHRWGWGWNVGRKKFEGEGRMLCAGRHVQN